MNINDMQMMVRYAVGGEMINEEELDRIDLNCGGKVGGQLMLPLRKGIISRIEGVNEIKKLPTVVDFIQYYEEKDIVDSKYIGTLQQLFGRVSFVADDMQELSNTINFIQRTLKVYDEKKNNMLTLPFDLNRIN